MQPNELLPDSKRARMRMGHVFVEYMDKETFGIVLAKKLGISVPVNYRYPTYWPGILEKMELRDFLDAITILYGTLNNSFQPDRTRILRERFLRDAREVFEEEKVSYRIDDGGGVHLKVDAAFEGARVTLISGLGSARYDNVRSNLDAMLQALDETPPDYKHAVRSVFSATEGLFKLTFQRPLQLNVAEIQTHLKPTIDRVYAGDPYAQRSSQKQVESFRDWVASIHFYRHEPGNEEPTSPPAETAILMVSQGMAFIRWLAFLDQSLVSPPLPTPEGTS